MSEKNIGMNKFVVKAQDSEKILKFLHFLTSRFERSLYELKDEPVGSINVFRISCDPKAGLIFVFKDQEGWRIEVSLNRPICIKE